MGYPKKHRGRRKIGSKKRRARKRNKKIEFMDIFNSIFINQSMSYYFSKSWDF